METLLSWAASLADPESNRRYRHTWSPSTLPTIAALCPFVVYGRIENRIRDLERGGDGFGVPYCNLNGRCVCGTFQFCCCCFCCCASVPSPSLLPSSLVSMLSFRARREG